LGWLDGSSIRERRMRRPQLQKFVQVGRALHGGPVGVGVIVRGGRISEGMGGSGGGGGGLLGGV